MFKKGLKIGCFSILVFFGLLFILAILGVLPEAPIVDEAETIEKSARVSPKPPEKTNTPGSVKVPPPPTKSDYTAGEKETVKKLPSPEKKEDDISQLILRWEKEKEAEWNLPENANLKNLIRTSPVTETLKHVTETWEESPESDTVAYAQKTLAVRQMQSRGRFRVEDIIFAEYEVGPKSYMRKYESWVVEVQGKVSRVTLDGEIEFEVWHKKFVIGFMQCEFPESQYNQLHSMVDENSFVRIKGVLEILVLSPGKAYYSLKYCSLVN